MAKPILTQILDREIETIHRGFEWTYSLPEFYQVDKETLYNEDKLVEFLKGHGVLLGILHAGFQNDIITCRAIGRPGSIDGEPQNLTPEIAKRLQVKITEHKPNLLPDPSAVKTSKNTSKAVAEVGRKMAISFAQAGTPWDIAKGILAGAGFTDPTLKDIYDRALEG